MIKQVMMALAVMTGVAQAQAVTQFADDFTNVRIVNDYGYSEQIISVQTDSRNCHVRTDRNAYSIGGQCSRITWGQMISANRQIRDIQGVEHWSHPIRSVFVRDTNGDWEWEREGRLRDEVANKHADKDRLKVIEQVLIREFHEDRKASWKSQVASAARHNRLEQECNDPNLSESRRQGILRHGNGGGSDWAWIGGGEWFAACGGNYNR